MVWPLPVPGDLHKQLRNLLSSDAQSQWDCICCKMHERDLWAAVNGQVTKGRRPRTWTSFLDCLELDKLTVFSADAAKRQWFYIQQSVRKPQRATVWQHILQVGVLNDCVKHLPMLKDSSKAIPTTKKGNIPFGKAVIAAIVLSSVPMSGRTSTTSTTQRFLSLRVPCYRTLRPSSKSWLRRKVQTLRQKEKAVQPHPKPKVTQSAKRLDARLVKSLKRVAVRSFANVAKPMAVPS